MKKFKVKEGQRWKYIDLEGANSVVEIRNVLLYSGVVGAKYLEIKKRARDAGDAKIGDYIYSTISTQGGEIQKVEADETGPAGIWTYLSGQEAPEEI